MKLSTIKVDEVIRPKKPYLITLTGKAGAGKDTVAKFLKEEFIKKGLVVKTLFFAKPVKDIAMVLGCSHDDVYTQYGKKQIHRMFGMTNREILTKIGTDLFRKQFHPLVWIYLLIDSIVKLKNNKNVDVIIVTDVRYQNEYEMLDDIGGVEHVPIYVHKLKFMSEIYGKRPTLFQKFKNWIHGVHSSETMYWIYDTLMQDGRSWNIAALNGDVDKLRDESSSIVRSILSDMSNNHHQTKEDPEHIKEVLGRWNEEVLDGTEKDN
jgi:hypothetical protein